MKQFNTWLALKITDGVATMWCAYIFAALAFVSLPNAIAGGVSTIISWIAQTFLQLVLLSIILVGQKLQADQTITHVKKHLDNHHDRVNKLLDAHHDKISKLIKEKK